jgi:DNA-binding transcriptional MerR regulator
MYTIKQASIRIGVGVPLLRAWERRYGVPAPARTPSGYRLYDDRALDGVRRMKLLVDSGMSARQAAESVRRSEATAAGPAELPGTTVATMAAQTAAPPPLDQDQGSALAAQRVGRFVAAARALDDAGMEALLGEAMAALGVDEAIDRFVLPAMVAIGEAWARGELSVAGEHAASSAVGRRLAGLFEAAGTPVSSAAAVVGLAGGARHEIGALAFAVACRRAGLSVLYLGPDVPLASWLEVVVEQPDRAVVLGGVTALEAEAALEVAGALRAVSPRTPVAIGGAGLGPIGGRLPDGVVALPEPLPAAVAGLADLVSRRRGG